jgi:maleylacetate reductase
MRAFVHDTAAARVVFAPGAVDRVPDEADRLGAGRVLLIAEGGRPDGEALAEALGPRVVARWSEVVMHVPAPVADRAAQVAMDRRADLLVSLGGGSATGLAKAVALRTGVPILAIPTTYAGSEMTPIWGQTADARKTTGRDPRVLPRVVVYDPRLTLGLPARVAAGSGMNALAHAVEGLYSAGASPVTALLADEAVRALASALPRVVAAPTDLDARGEALYGAWLAGWVLGTAGMGVHHKVCHVLGGTWNLPHADVHSAVLPYAAAFNASAAPEAMARLANALGADPGDAPGALWDLARAVGAATSLAPLGFPADAVALATDLVVAAAPDNPRPVDQTGVTELLHAALRGQRPAATVGIHQASLGGPGHRGGYS